MYFREKVTGYYEHKPEPLKPNIQFYEKKFTHVPLTVGEVSTSSIYILNPMRYIKENFTGNLQEFIDVSKMKQKLFYHTYDILIKHDRTNYLKLEGVRLLRRYLSKIQLHDN